MVAALYVNPSIILLVHCHIHYAIDIRISPGHVLRVLCVLMFVDFMVVLKGYALSAIWTYFKNASLHTRVIN